MNNIPQYSRLLVVAALATSSALSVIQTANANTNQPEQTQNTEAGASLLGQPQIGTNTAVNLPTRELPTFEVEKTTRRSRGILGVLGGRFVDEDRHPSFRNSTLPKK